MTEWNEMTILLGEWTTKKRKKALRGNFKQEIRVRSERSRTEREKRNREKKKKICWTNECCEKSISSAGDGKKLEVLHGILCLTGLCEGKVSQSSGRQKKRERERQRQRWEITTMKWLIIISSRSRSHVQYSGSAITRVYVRTNPVHVFSPDVAPFQSAIADALHMHLIKFLHSFRFHFSFVWLCVWLSASHMGTQRI